jgi:hypothetical protein
MKRIIRKRWLTPEEAAQNNAIRRQVEKEFIPLKTLYYDGFGINDCDVYKSRLATFTERGLKQGKTLGPLLAASPELLEKLKDCAMLLRDAMEWGKAYGMEPGQIKRLEIQAQDAEAVLAKARPG